MTTLRWIRLAGLVYGAMLTVLLLTPDPAGLIGLKEIPSPPGGRTVHFAFFTVLALLVNFGRWPVRTATLAAILVSYAAVTELFQNLVPHRTMELADLLENLLGLGAGTYLWWRFQPFRGPDQSEKSDNPALSALESGNRGNSSACS